MNGYERSGSIPDTVPLGNSSDGKYFEDKTLRSV
jgi:hypothetical protein